MAQRWRHGPRLLRPLVAAWIAWQPRDQLLALTLKPAWWSVPIMLWSIAQGYLGTLAADLFLQRTSVVITLVGVLLIAGGTGLIVALAFPLLLLPFMIPFPGVVYNQITFPLQLLASQVAEGALKLIRIPVCEGDPQGRVFLTADQRLHEAALLAGFDGLLLHG